MTLRPIRIDYVPAGTVCHKCRHPLEEARIILALDGTELFYGPDCVKLVLTDEGRSLLRQIPDLTRRGRVSTKSLNSNVDDSDVPGEENGNAARHAAEYLWIRLDKIAVLCPARAISLKYSPLIIAFDTLRDRGYLLDAEIQHVLNIERKAPPELRLANLLDVYAADIQLQKKIGANRSEFLGGLQQQLRKKLSLSQKQIETATLKLSKTAFAWRKSAQTSQQTGRN